MRISNLQVLRFFAQLTHPAYIRFQLSPVTTNNTDSYYCPLPFVLKSHLCNRGVETGTQSVLQAAHGAALVLQGASPWDHYFDGEQGDEKGWIRHGIDRWIWTATVYLFVLLKAGLILHETSNITHGGETNHVMATVTLYASIYNLFTRLPHLPGAVQGQE